MENSPRVNFPPQAGPRLPMKQKRLLWIQSPPEKAVPASCGHSFYSRGSLQQEFLRELAEISFCNSVGTLSPFLVLVKTVTFHCSTLFLSRLLSFFQQNGAGSFCMSSEERKSPTRKTCLEGLASTCHLPRLPAPSLLSTWLDADRGLCSLG